jgi:hypothetical protein
MLQSITLGSASIPEHMAIVEAGQVACVNSTNDNNSAAIEMVIGSLARQKGGTERARE